MSKNKSKPPVVDRQLVTFSCFAKEKVTKKKATPVSRPSGTLDQPQVSGAAQLDLAGRTPRAPLRYSNITSDLAEVFFQPSRMANCFISARLSLRFLAADRGGAQGNEKQKIQCALCARSLVLS